MLLHELVPEDSSDFFQPSRRNAQLERVRCSEVEVGEQLRVELLNIEVNDDLTGWSFVYEVDEVGVCLLSFFDFLKADTVGEFYFEAQMAAFALL